MQTWNRVGMPLLAAALAVGAQAGAQELTPIGVELGPPPRPIAIYVADRPTVTVTLQGDYGPVRVTGTLEEAPRAALRLSDAAGRPREAQWSEVRSLAVVRSASEGLPIGSFAVTLIGDGSAAVAGSAAPVASGYLSPAFGAGAGQGGWRLLSLPEGRVTVRGATIGRLSFEAARLMDLTMEPVVGTIVQLPRGTLRVEVLAGTVVSLQLEEVQSLRRDLPQQTISVTLADGQHFSGKLVELPRVSVAVQASSAQNLAGGLMLGVSPVAPPPPVPLERIVQLDVRVPGTGGVLGR